MDILLAIQIAKALADAVQEGIPLVQKVTALLQASDDPTAQAALADLKAAYVASGAEADLALDAAINR